MPDGAFVCCLGSVWLRQDDFASHDCRARDDLGGEVRIDGKRVNDVAPKDRDVAMVFVNYALYPHLTVRDNIAFPC